jgi:hypothetical protein
VPFVDPESRQAALFDAAVGGAEDLEADATSKREEDAQDAMLQQLLIDASAKSHGQAADPKISWGDGGARHLFSSQSFPRTNLVSPSLRGTGGSEAPPDPSPRHDFLAAAKRKRDGRVAKAQRERAQRLLKLESVDGGTADAEDGEHKKGHTRIVAGNAPADAPRRGSGRVVRAGSKYVLAQLNDQAQDSQIVERRPWYALSLSLSLSLSVCVCLSLFPCLS